MFSICKNLLFFAYTLPSLLKFSRICRGWLGAGKVFRYPLSTHRYVQLRFTNWSWPVYGKMHYGSALRNLVMFTHLTNSLLYCWMYISRTVSKFEDYILNILIDGYCNPRHYWLCWVVTFLLLECLRWSLHCGTSCTSRLIVSSWFVSERRRFVTIWPATIGPRDEIPSSIEGLSL